MTSKSPPQGDVVTRAYAAWYRAGNTEDPDRSGSGITSDAKGRDYVVLQNRSGVLAVYRITTQDQLKRLRRWPAEVVDN